MHASGKESVLADSGGWVQWKRVRRLGHGERTRLGEFVGGLGVKRVQWKRVGPGRLGHREITRLSELGVSRV
jgi:hypothetical protein